MTTQQALQARLFAFDAEMALLEIKGGRGSGNWGHAGRPGKRGGSSSRGGAMSRPGAMAPVDNKPHGAGKPGRGTPPAGTDKLTEWMADGVTLTFVARGEKHSGVPYPNPILEQSGDAGVEQLQFADMPTRQRTKVGIIDELSRRTGLDPETVNKLVETWAKTSAGRNLTSLELQAAAARFTGRHPGDNIAGSLIESRISHPDAKPAATNHEMDIFIKAMYENTQEQLAAAGLKPTDTVRVYRGVSYLLPDGSKAGGAVEIKQNPMTSWSLSRREADAFVNGHFDDGSGTLAMDVPVSAIISTARTGVGCLNEAEVVVIDTGQHRARAINSTAWMYK